MITKNKNPEKVTKLAVGSTATPADGELMVSGLVTASGGFEAHNPALTSDGKLQLSPSADYYIRGGSTIGYTRVQGLNSVKLYASGTKILTASTTGLAVVGTLSSSSLATFSAGIVSTNGIYSGFAAIVDDNVTSFVPPVKGCTIMFQEGSTAYPQRTYSQMVWCDTGASHDCQSNGLTNMGSGLEVSTVTATGVPDGTTGTDGKVTITAGTNIIYIENRTGADRSWYWSIIG